MVEALRLVDINFRYRSRTENALKNISLTIREKDIILIAGKSGSGKSSIIRVINGLIPHFYDGVFQGNIYYYDEDITQYPANQRYQLGITTVLQFPEEQLLGRKVWRAVAFGLANLGYPREEIIRLVRNALKLVGMEKFFEATTTKLSSGQKQKIVLASAIVLDPKILLLDEPTSQLDPVSAREFIITLKNLRKEKDITIILSEHRFDELFNVVNNVIILDNGKIILEGSPRKVFFSDIPAKMGIGCPKIVHLCKYLRTDLDFADKDTLINLLRNSLRTTHAENPPHEYSFKRVYKTSTLRTPILRIQDLWFRYSKEWIIKGISLIAYPKEFIIILGENGAGKTTLARLIIGALKPVKGKIYIGGIDINKKKMKDLAGIVAYAPQNPEDMIFCSTIYDEIAFTLRNLGKCSNNCDEYVREIASKFKLQHLLFKSPFSLSGGEKLRVVLASLYALKPKVLILDEPTRGLDWETKLFVVDEARKLANEGSLVIMITHDIELVVESPVDRVIVLKNGQIIFEGDKRKVLGSSKITEFNLLPPVIYEIMSQAGFEGIISLNDLKERVIISDKK